MIEAKCYIIENARDEPIHIPRPSGGKDISLGPWEAQTFDPQEWPVADFVELARSGRLRFYGLQVSPGPIPKLPPEAPRDFVSRLHIYRMAFDERKVDEGTYFAVTGCILWEFEHEYLMTKHYRNLRWAAWLLRERPQPEGRLAIIEKRIAEIEEMTWLKYQR